MTESVPADESAMSNRRGPSLHDRIYGEIERQIVSGAWPPGHRLPFEIDLAQDYGCARMTVNKVLTRLAAAGLIERRRKSGSVVAAPRGQSAVLEIPDIRAEIEALGHGYGFEILSRQARRATAEDMQGLGLPAPGPVAALRTLHRADGRPFCLEDRLISLAAVPEAQDADFSEIPPGSYLLTRVPWSEAEHRIRATAADRTSAHLLAVESGTPLLVIERRTWKDGSPVTQVRLSYRGDRHSLVARFTPSQARPAAS